MSVIKRRRNHGLVGGCIIGGGIATIVTVVLTVSGVFGATAAPRVGGVIPASAIAQLTSIAAQQAAINGDASPTSVLAVEATHAAALTVATPGDVLPQSAASEAVYLITMTGSFIGNRTGVAGSYGLLPIGGRRFGHILGYRRGPESKRATCVAIIAGTDDDSRGWDNFELTVPCDRVTAEMRP
jgi:hypothetical protein